MKRNTAGEHIYICQELLWQKQGSLIRPRHVVRQELGMTRNLRWSQHLSQVSEFCLGK